MTRYERLFGAGPRGLVISLILLVLARWLESPVGLPPITDCAAARWAVFAMGVVGAIGLAFWGFRSLPPAQRGADLVTCGAYKYLRHPVYASLLSSFNFGLAVFLNNWIYMVWALALHGVWHWNIRGEEKLMTRAFPKQYADYCGRTGRFVPRLRSLLRRR